MIALVTYNPVEDCGVDKVIENGDVDSSDDKTLSVFTCLVEWLTHTSEIIIQRSTMYLRGGGGGGGGDNNQ